MKYGMIKDQTAKIDNAETIQDAYAMVGLDSSSVDHASLSRRLGIVVGEFSIMEKTDTPKFWSIGRGLFQGPAVIYQIDGQGETVDLEQLPPILFYRDAEQVNQALAHDHINRPFRAVTTFDGDSMETDVQWIFGDDKPE